MKTLLTILLFILVSCTSIDVVYDPAPPAISNHYPTLMLKCNSQKRMGLVGCAVPIGFDWKGVSIEVETIGEAGVIQIVSVVCGIDKSYTYRNEGEIGTFKVPLVELLGNKIDKSQKCLLRIDEFPRYKNHSYFTSSTRGYFGYVYIRAHKNARPGTIIIGDDKYVGVASINLRHQRFVSQLKKQKNDSITLIVTGSKKGTAMAVGCGDEPIYKTYSNGKIDLKLSEIFQSNYRLYGESCISHIRAVPIDSEQDIVFAILINVYQPEYVKLPTPQLKSSSGKCNIVGSDFVMRTRINNEMFESNNVDFECLNDTEYLIKQYTSQGRSAAGILKNGKIKWDN